MGFYDGNLKSAESVLREIKKLEREIEDFNNNIRLAQKLSPQTIIQLVEVKKLSPEMIIENWREKIRETQDKILKLVEDYPEVEPLYIIHKITK